ncbi:MAG: glycosyltransferase [Pseudolabrys sp.]|nr:glycosyltransferase [Pseudolabrys sp.]MDP2295762.1 glycosyltransferase [Pseudolabrys sp.]
MVPAPQVSVVIPVFNGEQTIVRALNSVFAQTFSSFEIIVVDDASSDRTADIIASYSDRLTIIRSTENRGAGAARNTGIAEARGRWVAFLDADDAWKPTKLERQIDLLERSRKSRAACATGYHLEKDGRKRAISLNLTPEQFRRDILFGCTISPGSTLIVERYVFDQMGGFDESFRRLEDWDWLLRFSERFEMDFVPEPLAEIYLTPRDFPPSIADTDPVHAGICRMGDKHAARLGSFRKRMQLKSSLLIEHAAALHRNSRPLAAALYVIAGLAVYPVRNAAFFRTLWRATKDRIIRQTVKRWRDWAAR